MAAALVKVAQAVFRPKFAHQMRIKCHNAFNNQECRTLFSYDFLGVSNFMHSRGNLSRKLKKKDEYWAEMRSYVETTQVAFPDDMYAVIHLSRTKEHVELLTKLMGIYYKQTDAHMTTFICAPSVMRMLRLHNMVDEALAIYHDERFHRHFIGQITILIFFDLLLSNGRHQDILDCLSLLKSRSHQNLYCYTSEIATLAMAACYKVNSKESLEFMGTIVTDTIKVNRPLSFRASAFGILMSINHNDSTILPDIMRSVLSAAQFKLTELNDVFYLNILALAFVKLGQLEEAELMLERILTNKTGPPVMFRQLEKLVYEESDRASFQEKNNWSAVIRLMKELKGHYYNFPIESFIMRRISSNTMYYPPPREKRQIARK